MSYRSDMEFLKRDQARPKALGLRLLKITVIALAAVLLVTAVAVPVTLFIEHQNERTNDDDDDGAGSSGRLRIVSKSGTNATATAYLGDAIAYKSLITVSGGSGNYDIKVDASNVVTGTAGSYPVYYTVTDSAGRSATYTLTLTIKDGSSVYTEERLMMLVAAKATELGITDSMTTEQKVRKIYDYVKSPSKGKNDATIYFSDVSNTPSQKNQSGFRTGWETDWVEEACRTLTMSRMEGDCYTYYSVSKAFFEYFGIENYGIQRTGSGKGTHFWQAVNIGTKSKPQWYYYDATRLAGTFSSDGTQNSCLITEAKLQSYQSSDGSTGFYELDKSQYTNFPTISTTPLS